MAVPWLQIVSLMPSILDVSRELLKRTRKTPTSDSPLLGVEGGETDRYEARIRALEENERRQAELVTTMADQPLAAHASPRHRSHKLTRWLIVTQVVTSLVAVVALVVALR